MLSMVEDLLYGAVDISSRSSESLVREFDIMGSFKYKYGLIIYFLEGLFGGAVLLPCSERVLGSNPDPGSFCMEFPRDSL